MRPILLLVLMSLGCEGVGLVDGLPDSGQAIDASSDASSRPDGSNATDTGVASDAGERDTGPRTDVGPDTPGDPCLGVNCGANAACVAGTCACATGFIGDPVAGCTPADPCATVDCPYGATCNMGQCACDTGFTDNGAGGCTQVTPGDTAARTRDEVCNRWNSDRALRAATLFQVDPANACDPGVLHPDVLTDALRRTTLYRWLVGLPAVTSNTGALATTQACATTLAASNKGLSHSLDATWTCYSPEAGQGAGSSNLAQGVSNPADSVDLYVGDIGVRSLGHRRWVLNPSMGATAFGQRGSYSCMYAFDMSGNANPQYVAYPAPGIFPRAALRGYWSFGSRSLGFSDQTTVTVKKVSDGSDLAVSDVYVPGGGYGIQVVAWQVAGLENEVEYEVTVANLTGATPSVTYRTTLTTCN